MPIAQWFQQWLSSRRVRSAPHDPLAPYAQLSVQRLEDRRVLSVSVTTPTMTDVVVDITGMDDVTISFDGVDTLTIDSLDDGTDTTIMFDPTMQSLIINGDNIDVQTVTLTGMDTLSLVSLTITDGVDDLDINTTVAASQNISIDVANTIDIGASGGLTTTTGSITLEAGMGITQNAAATIDSGMEVHLTSLNGNIQTGIITAVDDIQLTTDNGSVTTDGALDAGGLVDIDALSVTINSTIDADGMVTIDATDGAITVSDTISAGNDIDLTAEGATGSITVNGGATVTTIGSDIRLFADQTIHISADVMTDGMGTITLSGHSGAMDEGALNIFIDNDATISTENGDLTLDADQGTQQAGTFSGIVIDGMGTSVEVTGTGSLSLYGRGGDDTANQHGIVIQNGAMVTAGTTGTAVIEGFGGTLSSSAVGVMVTGPNSALTSSGANVEVSGEGGGNGGFGFGVYVVDGGQISATGAGSVTVAGTGGTGAGLANIGVFVTGTNSLITASGGDVEVTGIEGGGASAVAIGVASEGTISQTSNGQITLIGDSLTIDDLSFVDAGTGTVSIQQYTSTVEIDLGSTSDVAGGPLAISSDELARITAGTLVIGDANSGTITISDAIDLSTISTLELITTADIFDGNATGIDITVASLVLVAGTGIGSSDALELAVTNLAFRNTASGDVQIENTGALTLTTVGTLDGTTGFELGNLGGGTTAVTAHSPVTIAADVTSVGSMTITAGESNDAPNYDDDLTINTGVTVSVTGGASELILQAGDDVIIDGAATSNLNLIVTAGFNDLDSSGAIVLSGTLTATELTTLTAVTGITDSTGALITTSELEILGSGDVILDEEHQTAYLAANLDGALTYLDADGFDVSLIDTTNGITLTANTAELHLTTTTGVIGLDANVTTDGNQFYHSDVELLTDVALAANSGNIDFEGTVDGAYQLSITSGNDVTFDLAVGSTDELGSIDINVSGKVTVSDAVQLAAAGPLLGTFTVFADEFELTGSIDTQDGDPLGGGVFILANNIRLGGDITTDEGNVDLVGPVILFDTTTITTDEGSVSFLDTIDGDAGGENLTVTSTSGGVILTSAEVGGTTAAGNLAFTSNAPAGTIVLSGDITSEGNVTLSAESVLVSGTIDTTGATVGDVTITSTFLTTLTGDITTTNGNIELNGFTRLDNSLTLMSGSGNISINGFLDSNDLGGAPVDGLTIIATTGDVIIEADLGSGTTPGSDTDGLVSLAVTAGGDFYASGTWVIDSTVTFTSAVYLLDDLSITANGDVTFEQTVDADPMATSSALDVNGDNIDFQGIVGGQTALTSLTVDASGDLSAADDVTVVNDIAWTSAGNTGITADGAITSEMGSITLTANGLGSIDIAGNATAATDFSATTAAGDMTFQGMVEATAGSVEFTNAGQLVLEQSTTAGTTVTQNGAGNVTLGGDINAGDAVSFASDVVLTADVMITSVTGGVTFAGTVDADNTNGMNTEGLDIDAGDGLVDFQAAVGNTTALDFLTVTTTGNINADSTLDTTGTIDLTADQITLDAAVTAGDQLKLTATTGITAADDLQAETAIAIMGNVTTGGNLLTNNGTITVTGNVTLTADVRFDSDIDDANNDTTSDITVTGTIDLATFMLTLDAGTGSDIDLQDNVTGTGDLIVEEGDEQTYSTIAVNDFTILDATTSIVLTGTVTATTAGMDAGDISICSSGTLEIQDTLTADGMVDLKAASGIKLDAGFTVNDITFQSAVLLCDDVTIDATGDVVFQSTIDSAVSLQHSLTVNTSGLTDFQGEIGGGTNQELGTLTTDAAGTTQIGADVTTAFDQFYNDAVTLTADVTLTGTDNNTSGEAIEFGSTLTGGNFDLTISGGAAFADAVTGLGVFQADRIDTESTFAATSVTVTGTSDLGDDVTTTAFQDYQGNVTLTADVVLESTGDDQITLSGTVNGAFALNANTGGTTTFEEDVGGITALTSLMTDATGSTVIDTANVKANVIDFGDAVTLDQSVTMTSTTSVTFQSTVEGNAGTEDLTVNSSGTVDFDDEISNLNDVTVNADGVTTFSGDIDIAGTLSTDANGTTTIDTANIAADVIDFGDAVTLDQSVTMTGTTSVTFQSTVEGNAGTENLTVNSDDTVDFGDAISNLNDVTVNADGVTTFSGDIDIAGTLSTDANGSTTINTANITADVIDFGDAVTLDQSVTITGTTSATFQSTVMGNAGTENLTVNSNGTVDFDDEISNLNDVTVNADGVTTFSGDVDIAGTLLTNANGTTTIDRANIAADVIDFGDAVTLDQSVTITGTTSVTFQSTVEGNAGTENLTVNSDGTVDFDDEISNLNDVTVNADSVTTFSGDIDIAGTLSTDANGMTKIDTATIDASVVQFGDAVELCQDLAITAGQITFGSTLDEAVSSAGSNLTLTITDPNVAAGDITFTGAVGSSIALDSLTITAANDVLFTSTVEVIGDLEQQAGTGTTALNGTGTTGIGGQLLVTTDTVTFSTADAVTVGAVVITAQNAITFNTSAGLNAGASTITLKANQDNTGSQGLTQADGTVIQTTNNSATAIVIDVDGTGSAAISDLRADTVTGVVTITVGGAITDNTAGEAANITAAATALTAVTGIGGSGASDIDTDVSNLEALTDTGGITIEEADDVTIGNVNGTLGGVDVTTSGAIRITANGSLTVAEQVSGFDAISLTALGSTSDLTILMNSGVTTDNGAITLSADRTVTISEDVSTGGSGTISITGNSAAGARNIVVDSGAIVSVANGTLLLDADQGAQQTGNFVGISINGAMLQSTGSGNITLSGRGGDDSGGSQFGIAVTNSGLVTTSGTGDVTFMGIGGTNAGGLNHGIVIDNASVTATGTSAIDPGDIALTATAGSNVNSVAMLLSNNGTLSAVNANFAAGACVTLTSLGGDVTEQTGFTITADNLQLLGGGVFTLDRSNDVDVLAADIDDALTFVDIDDLIIGTVKTTVGITTTGDDVEITATGNLTIDDDIDTSPGSGGVISVTGATLNAQLIAGAGDITLTGGNPDLIINVAQSSATTITYSATRDVIINATITTTGMGADVIVTADSDLNGVGGVQVTQNGQINSADAITLTGSDLFATATSNDSLRIDADGTNDQLLAVGDITLLSGTAAPAGADIVINGRMHSTTGDIEIDALDTILAQTRIAADAGSVTFQDAVVLTGDFTVVAGTDAVFAATVNDDTDTGTTSNLTVSTAGTTTFTGAVGNLSAIDSLTTNAGGTTELCGGSVTTVNGQTYADAVILCANTTLTSNSSGAIEFQNTVNGDGVADRSLAVNTSGLTDFQGTVGNSQALASLITDAAGTTQIGGGSIRTVGAQTYNDAVLLTNDALLTSTTSGNITFQKTVNGVRNLTINTAGTTQFNGVVGGTTALLSLNTDAAGSTVINTSAVTAGVINFDDAVTINTTTTITGTTSVDFADTIAGNTGAESLTVVSSGAASFHDTVTNLTNFLINATGQTTFEGDININGTLTTNAAGLTRIDTANITAGTVTFNDAVELAHDVTITAGTIRFASTLNEAAVQTGSDLTLTITNPALTTGDITFSGAVGATTALDSITITNANDVTFSSTVRLTGDLLQQDGTGTTTFTGTSGTGIGGQLNVSTNAITFNTTDVVTVGAVQLTADNGIAFNSNAGLNAGAATITILANQDGTGSESLTQASSAIIRTTNQTTAAVHIEVGGTGNANIGDIRAGTTTGVVSITAGGSIVDNLTGEAANITAHAAALRSASGIGSADDINTVLDQLAFSCTAGLVNVSNSGNLTLTTVDGLTTSLAFSGGTVFASASLTIAMTTQVGGTFNFIAGDSTSLVNDLTISADITHLTGIGEITFQAGDDIIQTAGTITVTDGNSATLSRVNMIADHEASGADGDRGGITQTGGNILAGELQIRSYDAVDMNQATNDVDVLASVVTNNGQAFTYRDADDLTISQASGGGGVVGITTNNGNVTVITGGLLTLGVTGEDIAAGNGTVVINTQGGFTESTGSVITANQLLFLGTGIFTADQSNDVNALAANIDGTLTFRDVDDLVIGTVNNTVAMTTTSGITTANDDVKITTVNGNLTIGDNVGTAGQDDINLGTGDLTLNVTGAVTQLAGDAILANGLLLFGTGTVTLNETTNNIGTLAASYDGAIAYTDSNALVIGTVTDNPTSVTASGISTSNDDVKLTVLAGGLTIGDAVGSAGQDDINLGTGDLTLNVVGNVTQLANDVITASGLQLLGSGTVTLNESNNNVATLAANYNGTIAYSDSNTLVIGTVTDGTVGVTTSGITTSNDDVKLTVLAGGLNIGDTVGTNGQDDINLGTGDLTLNIVGNVTQSSGDVILAGGLQLLGTGVVTLNQSGNNVATLAANYNGTIAYTDANGLIIGTVIDDASLMTTSGITTSNDDVKLALLTGGLTIGDAVGTLGQDDIQLGTGDLTLNVVGAITQTAGSAITANGLQLLGSGTITLNDTANDVSILAANYNGTIAYTDANALTIGTVTDDASLMKTYGIKTSNDDVTLTTGGALTLTNQVPVGTNPPSINLGAATLTLDSQAGVIFDSGVVYADEVLLLGVGDFEVNGAFSVIAADVEGSVSVSSLLELSVDTVNGVSGITTGGPGAGGDVTISTVNFLNINEVIDTGTGTGGIIVVTGGVLNATLVAGAGNITLNGGVGTGGNVSDIFIFAPQLSQTTQIYETEDSIYIYAAVSATDLQLTADVDIVILATVSSTVGDITITADAEQNGIGGVLITTAGQVNSAADVTIDGSDLSSTAAYDGIVIEADGLNDQVLAVGDITFGPNQDIYVSGQIHSTDGDIHFTTDNNYLQSTIQADTGSVTFDNAVFLIGDLQVTAGADVTFSSIIQDDANSLTSSNLTITAAGVTRFLANVGPIFTIDSLTTNGGGTTEICANITTVHDQTYTDAVVLCADVILTSQMAGTITFVSTVDSDTVTPRALTVNTSGLTDFQAAVGQTQALRTLTTDATGTTQIGGGLVRTTSTQTYNDDVVLTSNATLETIAASANGADLRIVGTVDTQGFDLTIDAGTQGDITLQSAVTGGGTFTVLHGDVQQFAAITVDELEIQSATTSVTFHNAVLVTNNVTVESSGSITQVSTLDAGVDVMFAADTSIDIQGALTAGDNVTLDSGTSTTITAPVTATAGTIDINAGTSISATAALMADIDVLLTAGTAINLTGAVTASTNDITANAGTTFNATQPLMAGHDVTVTSNDEMTISGMIDAGNVVLLTSNLASIELSGEVTAGVDVTIDSATSTSITAPVTATAGSIDIDAGTSITVTDSLLADIDVLLNAGSFIDLTGTVTATNNDVIAIAGTTFDATQPITAGHDVQITANDEMTISGTVDAGNDVALTSNLASIELSGEVTAGVDVTIDSATSTTITAPISATAGTIDINAGTTISSTGAMTAGDAIALTAVDGTTLSATADLIAGPGGITITGSLTTAADMRSNNGAILLTGPVTLTGDVVWDSDRFETGGAAITVQGTLATADFNLTVDAGATGDLTFQSSLTGGGDVTIEDGRVIRFENVVTVDNLSIQDATTSVTFVDVLTIAQNLTVTSGGTITQQSTTTVGNDATYTAHGQVRVQDDLIATSDVSLTSQVGAVTITALVTATNGNLTISAGTNVTSNSALFAGTDLEITAVQGVSLTNTVDAGNDVTIDAGTAFSATQTLDAGHQLSITAGTTLTLAETADITAGVGGVVLTAPQIITAAEITTDSGDVLITGAVRLTGDVTMNTGAAGEIQVTGTIDGTTAFTQSLFLTTNAGDISITGNVGTTTALNDIIITTADDVTFGGAISADRLLQQSGTGATSIVGAVNTFGSDGIQLTTTSIQFAAGTASMDSHGNVIILTADAITLPTTFTNAIGSTVTLQTLTDTTSIGLEDASQDLNFTDAQLDTIHAANLVIGSSTQTGGISVGADGQVSQDENLTLLTANSISVSGPLSATTSNTILLDAGNDISITGSILVLSGNLTVLADDDITFGAAGLVQSQSGDVVLTADADGNANGSGGAITMANGAVIDSGLGSLTLTADENITLGQITTDNATTSAIVLTSTSGGIVDGGDADVDIVVTNATGVVTISAVTGVGSAAGGGADAAIETQINQLSIVNSTSGNVGIDEVNAITILGVEQNGPGAVTLTSGGTMTVGLSGPGIQTQGGNITLITTGNSSDLVLNAAVTSRGGDISITVGDDFTQAVTAPVTSAGGDVTMTVAGNSMLAGLLNTDGGNWSADVTGNLMQSTSAPVTTNGGDIDLRVGGNLGLTASISTAGGEVSLDITGNTTIAVTAPISTAGGNLTAMIDGTTNLASTITTATGDVAFTIGGDLNMAATANVLTANGDFTATVNNAVTMQNGAVISTATGRIQVLAGNDITLGQLITTNSTASAVVLTSTTGGLIDGGDTGGADIIANSTGAMVTIQTASGVGSATGNGADAAIETQIDRLELTNTTTGMVQIDEVDALRILELTQSATGSVTVNTVGNLLVVGSQPGISATSGTVTLNATAPTASVTVDSRVLTTSGAIIINAADDVRMGAAASIVTTSGNVTITADADGSLNGAGGEIFLADGSVINAGSGNIAMQADQNITVSQLRTTNMVSLTSTSAGIVDGGDSTGADIIASSLVVQSVTGIGSANAMETAVSLFAANNTTSGAIQIDNNTGGLLTIGQVGTVIGITNTGTAAANITLTNNGGINVNGMVRNSTGGDINLTATPGTANLTVNAVITSTRGSGDIHLVAGNNLVINDSGSAVDISVVNGGEILGEAGGDVTIGSNVVIQSATGVVTNTEPVLMDVITPQISALGIGTITMTVQRPLEVGTVIIIDWGDGTVETFVVTDEGETTLTFTHQYLGPPDPANPAADIPLTVTVINPSFTSGTMPSPTAGTNQVTTLPYVPNIRFYANGDTPADDPVGDLNQTTVTSVFKTPGDGLATFAFDLTPPVELLDFPQPSVPDASLLNVSQPPVQGNTTHDVAGQVEQRQLEERVVLLEVLSPNGELRETVLLPEDVLDNLDGVIGNLPDGRYRFLLREPGETQTRLLQDVEVHEGKITDDLESLQNRPRSLRNTMPQNQDLPATPADPAGTEGNSTPADALDPENASVDSVSQPTSTVLSWRGQRAWRQATTRLFGAVSDSVDTDNHQFGESEADDSHTPEWNADETVPLAVTSATSGRFSRTARLFRKYASQE
ncbi:hypothetical protein GC163_11480 [bacterium]|nr:hypothetical protein [bacterium]